MGKRLLLVFAAFVVQSAYGQVESDRSARRTSAGPVRGVVWEMPSRTEVAVRDLSEMHRIGVEAVRTSVIRNAEVLTLADTLDIDFYVDLPIARFPAKRLRDTLDYAAAVLDTVLGLAQIHPSIRHIGLARHVDVTDSVACAAIERLADRARREGPSGTQVYYVTRFTTSDQCAQAVDFVLVDVRDRDNPIAPFRARRSGAVGVGALGIWVRSDTLGGLRVPSSPQAQARYFEEFLPILLSDTLSFAPRVVFVHRWRDVRLSNPRTAHDLDDPYIQRYGLRTFEGVKRPAYEVVKGIYTNEQMTFAFYAGSASTGGAPWTTFFGWGVIALLGTFYALSPRFRHMLPRYFGARFFYRDAVREGRDVLFGASTVLLIATSAACGLTVTVIVDVLRMTEPFGTAVLWLPRRTQDVVVTLLAEPYALLVLAGCAYAVAMILWTTVLSLLSTRRYPIAPGQALMLVVWPRWPLLILMLAAMVVASIGSVTPIVVLILGAAWILVSVLAVGRALMDFVLVTRIPIYLLIPAVILNPGVVAAIVLTVIVLPIQPELWFLWNMAAKP